MKKIGSQFLLFVIGGLLFSHFALANDIEVSGFVDREVMGKNDTFTYTVVVSSQKSVNVAKVVTPQWSADFKVLNSWQGSEFSSTFVNGSFRTTHVKKFNYQLQPKRKGRIRISPAQVVINDKRYNTKVIEVEVAEGSTDPPPRFRRRRVDRFQSLDKIFENFIGGRNRSFQNPSIDPEKAVFIQADVDKKSVYVGERIIVSFYIYVQGRLVNIDTLKHPSLKGFWKEEIKVPQKLRFSRVNIRGESYQRALLASYALFPLKDGISYIDSYEARAAVRIGMGRPLIKEKKNPRVAIEVKKLPQPVPPNFTGGVGYFDVESKVDRDKVEVSQPFLLNLSVMGSGNAKSINLPEIKYPEGLQVYSSQQSSQFFAAQAVGQKKAEILVTANREGVFEVPGVSVSFFDPKNKKYYSKTFLAKKIEVSVGKLHKNISENFMGANQKTARAFYPFLMTEWKEPMHNLTFSLALVCFLFFIFLFFLFKILTKTIFLRKKSQLSQNLQARINNIEALVEQKKWREVGVAATNAIYWALGTTFQQGKSGEAINKILTKVPPSLRQESEKEVRTLLEIFEALSFAPDKVADSIIRNKQWPEQIARLKKFLKKCINLVLDED